MRSMFLAVVICCLAVVVHPAAAREIQTWVHVSGFDFRPLASDVLFDYNAHLGPYVTSNANERWTAQVFLPHGAHVTKLRFYYIDNSSETSTLFLASYKPDNNSLVNCGSVTSVNGQSYSEADYDLTIDLEQYSYHLVWVPMATESIVIEGARISYTADTTNSVVLLPMGQ